MIPGSLAIKPFNLRIPFTPAAIVQPKIVDQVQAAVTCGAKLGISVSPKGGGHSYASHELGGEDGHLVVDMKYFTNVKFDSSTQIAAIGTGARLGNIAQSLYSQGPRAFSHGTCPGVGVAGHVGGGGYGYISHTHGLALDALVEATAVLANSTVVTASTTQNPGLFWAIRGAGASSASSPNTNSPPSLLLWAVLFSPIR
ncbi:FAD-binding domain-containing protein [Acephala macrosclerotiorum]|nr:FAD-binding domain-containing protein [Acephala macrosclerotiorum]